MRPQPPNPKLIIENLRNKKYKKRRTAEVQVTKALKNPKLKQATKDTLLNTLDTHYPREPLRKKPPLKNPKMISIDNAPRDRHELAKLTRRAHYMLATGLGLLTDDQAESAFLSMSSETAASILEGALKKEDALSATRMLEAERKEHAKCKEIALRAIGPNGTSRPLPLLLEELVKEVENLRRELSKMSVGADVTISVSGAKSVTLKQ